MAIKILANSVQPTRKSPNTGGITVDTGAAQFGAAVAQFGQTASNAINQYATAKATQEIKYKQQVADTSIEQSLQQLQQNILNPLNDDFNTAPDTWEEAYENGANEILQTMLASTDNSMLKQSYLASWNASKVKYEKDIVTQSTARTSALLKGAYEETFNSAANQLTNVTDLNELQIIARAFTDAANQYEAMGFLKDGESKKDIFDQYMGIAIKDRILNASVDVPMDVFIDSFQTGSLGEGDPITESLMTMISDDDLQTVLDSALDAKVSRISQINDAISKNDTLFKNQIDTEILAMESEPDPEKKTALKIDLINKYQDDDVQSRIIKAYNTNNALEDDPGVNISIVKKDIAFGNTSLDDLVAMKSQFSQTTYAGLVELLDNTNSPRSELANNLRTRLKNEIYGENDGFLKIITEEDPALAAVFSDSLATFNAMYENGLENLQSNETPQDVFDRVYEKATSTIKTRKAVTVNKEIRGYENDPEYLGIKFIMTDIPQTIKNINASSIAIGRKLMLQQRLDFLLQTYGPEIFRIADGMD